MARLQARAADKGEKSMPRMQGNKSAIDSLNKARYCIFNMATVIFRQPPGKLQLFLSTKSAIDSLSKARFCIFNIATVARLARRFYASSVVGEGEVLKKEHRFGQEEVRAYAALSGDRNPIHSLPSAAASAGFSACVVHGMLCASLFPSLIRSHFPGAFFKSKTLRFKEPALVGDCLEAEVKILSLRPAQDGLSVDFNMECYKKERRVLVIEGKSTIFVPNR